MLLRSSLSQERFVGEADNIVVHNIGDERDAEIPSYDNFFGKNYDESQRNDSF